MTKLQILREKDFGFYEGRPYGERPQDPSGRDSHLEAHRNDPGFREVESKEAMMVRSDIFVDLHLLPLLTDARDEYTIVVVAHGIILNHLWGRILKRFPPGNVAIAASADRGMSPEYLGAWSNTGVLDLEIKSKTVAGQEKATSVPTLNAPRSTLSPAEAGPSELPQPPLPTASSSAIPTPTSHTMLPHLSLVVKAVNSQEHLTGLKKTRGGIGSSKHDPSQKTMDSFFKRRTD